MKTWISVTCVAAAAFLGLFGAPCAQPATAMDQAPNSGPGQTSPTVVQDPSSDWLSAAVRADDFRETVTEFRTTVPHAPDGRSSGALASVPNRQPAGALTGKTVFTMAGHGWTYNHEYGLWYTQRPLRLGMVEDLGNADQMHLFAHLLWNAGATVVPLRPVDHQPIERVMDNTDPSTVFEGAWADSQSTVCHGAAGDRVPYRFAVASLAESAVARFRPYIPVSGDYPVYAWARDGADRVKQLYRVVHSGGATEVLVNHRRVGKGWVWLGTFPFERGRKGGVDVSNRVTDPYEADGGHVVVADAVRFGNGQGDVNRDGGISGFLREDEGDCYWVERSLGPVADMRIYRVPGDDGAATVGTPPKAAAYMNREADGGFFDRVLVSFHSNALRGQSRGVAGLYNQSPAQRPDYQEELAQSIGARLEDQFCSAPAFREPRFARRARVTYNGINFGELRRDYLRNEMCATIIEVAFHDNESDVRFLLDPRSRMDAARATLSGLLNWHAKVDGASPPMILMPAPPEAVAAVVRKDGGIRVSWRPGKVDKFSGTAPEEYRVAASSDGFGYSPAATTAKTFCDLPPPATSQPLSLRVTAFNAGGESLASETMTVLGPLETLTTGTAMSGFRAPSSAKRDCLIVTAYTSLDPEMNPLYTAAAGFGSALAPGGTAQRVRPLAVNPRNQSVRAARALASASRAFDCASLDALHEGAVRLDDYRVVVWLAGRQRPEDGILTTASQALLQRHTKRGGHLFLSGARVAESLDRPTTAPVPTKGDRRFLREVLHAEYLTTASRDTLAAAGVEVDECAPDSYNPVPVDWVKPARDAATSTAVALHPDGGGWLAAAPAKGRAQGGRVVYSTVPFETVAGEPARSAFMREVLRFLSQGEADAVPRNARRQTR
jgi:hypothetical protein